MEETYEGTFAKFKREQFEIGRKKGILLGWLESEIELADILLEYYSAEEVFNLLQTSRTKLAKLLKQN